MLRQNVPFSPKLKAQSHALCTQRLRLVYWILPDALLGRVLGEVLEHLVGAHDAHGPPVAPRLACVAALLSDFLDRTVARKSSVSTTK